MPECGEGLDRVLVEESRGESGACCDKFECRKKEPHCLGVHCSPMHPLEGDSLLDGECPEDSVRLLPHITRGTCCPAQSRCKCRAAFCRPATCSDAEKIKILSKGNGSPGRCCDEWECEKEEQNSGGKSCTWGSAIYRDGEEWHSTPCEICKCKKGVAQCTSMTCQKPPAECTWIVIPEGECCPVCNGCQIQGDDKLAQKKKNETWHKDDCTTCTCSEEGANVCERAMCSVECENPRKVEGQCCPVCDEPTILTLPSTCPSLEHCPLRCENGLKRDNNGCFQCECLPVVVPHNEECAQLKKDTCEKQCAHGYVKDMSGCVVCKCAKCPPLHQCMKHCLYGFENNALGCPVCKCRARIDAKLTITDRVDRLSGKERCVSLSASGRLVERDAGEWWNDGCRHCFCEHKQEYCSLISCSERPSDCPEEKWIQKDGACCPSCSVFTEMSPSLSKHEHTVCQSPGTGRLFTDGETWQLAKCVSCTCRVGHVLCRTQSCPAVPCLHPIKDPNGHCCETCPSIQSSVSSAVCTDDSGTARHSGSSWRTDDCTSCACSSEGVIECFRETCDFQPGCKGKSLTIKGRCCPMCSDELQSGSICSYLSSIYSLNEEWRDGPCRNCSCVSGGQTVCREAICPPCNNPVPIQGQCCPLCKDEGGWASFGSGNSLSISKPNESSGSTALVLGLSFCSLTLILVLFIVIILNWRRNAQEKQQKPSSKVMLSSCKTHGSDAHLPDFERRKPDADDGQSESLLSTTSESSAGMSQSSGHSGTHLLYKSSKYHVVDGL